MGVPAKLGVRDAVREPVGVVEWVREAKTEAEGEGDAGKLAELEGVDAGVF